MSGWKSEPSAGQGLCRTVDTRAGRPIGKSTIWAVAGIVAVAIVAGTHWRHDLVVRFFGPPAVKMREAHDQRSGAPTFDHSAYDALLKAHVDEAGWVDYAGLAGDADRLDGYINVLAVAPFDRLGRDGKLALLINAYNAFTLRLILDHWDGGKLKSIRDIPKPKRWDHARWTIGGETWSLDQIEHEQIRPKFAEPRIHFALVCAAVACPPLRIEAYTADRLEDQLADQAAYLHDHGTWFRFDAGRAVVKLTRLYNWYGRDFEQAAGSVRAFAARYSKELRQAVDAGRDPKIEWLDYDWRLNSVGNRKPR